MKFLPFLIVLVIAAGLYYVWQSDDDRGPQKVFARLEQKVIPIAKANTAQFLRQQKLVPGAVESGSIVIESPQSLVVDYQIKIEEQAIVIILKSTDERLANRQIRFEPRILKEKEPPELVWNCSGGDLLMRYRSKACRTGKGLKLTN